MDGFVFADVNIVRIFPDGQIGAVGQIREVFVLRGGDANHIPEFLGFLKSFLAPGTGDNVVGDAVFHQIHGQHGKLQGSTALNEQNLVIVGNVHQLPQIRFRFVIDGLENLGAVGHFHHGHTGAAVIEHFIPDFLQNGDGHGGRAGGEIVAAIVHWHYLH